MFDGVEEGASWSQNQICGLGSRGASQIPDFAQDSSESELSRLTADLGVEVRPTHSLPDTPHEDRRLKELDTGHTNSHGGRGKACCVPPAVDHGAIFDKGLIPREAYGILDCYSADDAKLMARSTVQTFLLSAFCAIFGAFLQNPAEYPLKGTNGRFVPCSDTADVRAKAESQDSRPLRNCLLKVKFEHEEAFSRLFEDVELSADFTHLVRSSGPCYCSAIVHAVTKMSTSTTPLETEMFLRPDVPCDAFGPGSTWPWNHDLSHGPDDSSHGLADSSPGRGGCLLRACLDNFDQSQEKEIEAMLLLLILQTNKIVQERMNSELSSGASQRGPGDPAREDALERPRTFEKMQVILKLIRQSLLLDSSWVYHPVWKRLEVELDSRENLSLPLQNLRKTVHQVQHIWRHYVQDNPESLCPSENTRSLRQECRCGRPPSQDIALAVRNVLHGAVLRQATLRRSNSSRLTNGKHETATSKGLSLSKLDVEDDSCASSAFLHKPLTFLLTKALAHAERPHDDAKQQQEQQQHQGFLEAFIAQIDSQENFSSRRDVLSLGVSSLEVMRFNSLQFLRLCKREIRPLWLSHPVTVFLRPGAWPGNILPLSVRHTAWRLARASCLRFRYGRDVLEALESDEEKRNRLIDLFVDMKQLKFAGEVDPDSFSLETLRSLQKEQRMGSSTRALVRSAAVVDPSAAVHVVREFLDIIMGLRVETSGGFGK